MGIMSSGGVIMLFYVFSSGSETVHSGCGGMEADGLMCRELLAGLCSNWTRRRSQPRRQESGPL